MGIHATHGDLRPQVRASPANWMAGSQAAGLEHEEQPSSSAFVRAVACTQLPADGFSRCVLPACRKVRRPWEQATTRVTGGLGGEMGGSF